MQNILLRSIRLVASVAFPVCIGLLLVADPLVRVMLTAKWLPIVPILKVLCIFALVRSVDILLPPVLWARGKAAFVFGYTIVLLVTMPVAFWIGASWAGPLGVALVWLTVYPCLMSRMAHKAISEIGIKWKTIWTELQGPLAATGIMAIVVLIVQWELIRLDNDFVRLVIMILAGGCTYALALFWFGRRSMAEIQEILGWLIRRNRPIATDSTRTI
jgi:O-antigen/teichoic acid export membrane protein